MAARDFDEIDAGTASSLSIVPETFDEMRWE
jgi:hypothetical protein